MAQLEDLHNLALYVWWGRAADGSQGGLSFLLGNFASEFGRVHFQTVFLDVSAGPSCPSLIKGTCDKRVSTSFVTRSNDTRSRNPLSVLTAKISGVARVFTTTQHNSICFVCTR
jgi:hypothetical protein